MAYPWSSGDVLTSSDLNDAFGESWQAASFGTNFTNFGGTYAVVEYRREADTVRVRGLAKATATVAVTEVVMSFPVGYRPPNDLVICTAGSESGVAPSLIVLELQPGGNLMLGGGTNMVSGNYLTLNFTFALS